MSSDSAPTSRRVIKRYSNRKLYDTRDSRYVTLQQIGEMVRQGEDVQIIDNKTKEDKTEVTLALILSEDLKNKPRSVPLNMLRTLIQERGERLLSSLREGPIGRLIPKPEEAVEPEPPAPPPTEGGPKKRLNELVESSRHTLDQLQASIDERVAAIVPGVGTIRELRAKVETLTRRIEAIEKKLGITEGDGAPE
ncbi:MAG TPA: polyhydroxyalkanoate synthesis regulator DNA-binding domain-containing protein [Polyangiaceae bacterium]|jgi:polyhydroxyalkanoate synthesis repressor PhaR|nr:polyhydroxyalkanoate synthesis regulator DNA-binding domain-containing protein [Polyangiaceae bacterium]